jgi:hypothetical protein
MRFFRHVLASLTALFLVTGLAAGQGTLRDSSRDNYNIMAPEPWLPPKYQSPRGLPQRPKNAQPRPTPPPSIDIVKPAPPTVLPNGQTVPNLPPVRQGIVPGGGRETFQDRATRCAHQSGLYGVPAGQQNTYMHSCTQ